ncbi:hypothetical protein PC129_g24139 [Phytophthora cactorum]|uniref:Uncharacterized protein n=1 Tax=Phytophthora cactorum TaxID=29920 RepID=A0A329RX16_9STRA|nr:hypothetical protein Pcac1_g6119 [Phytophthora cactorum]KAG2816869.1 hypothetical protein PC112_g13276 [Phytophthora cactorum]KAG2818435.1 hypothetical protein PC111_g12297 [Phytophthora cactorum]KAG2853651.1 hypothetical protein PC113_g13977 [Phytophthora cactorum]KAG2897126.1 hypothetical protein PC114_g14798 [Phytophthora cactorum]
MTNNKQICVKDATKSESQNQPALRLAVSQQRRRDNHNRGRPRLNGDQHGQAQNGQGQHGGTKEGGKTETSSAETDTSATATAALPSLREQD